MTDKTGHIINKRADRLVFISFWLFIALISYIQDITGTIIEGYKNDYVFTLIACIGSLLWIPITPLVSRLSQFFPFTKQKIFKTFLTHLGLATAVASFHLLIEGFILYLVHNYLGKVQFPTTFLIFHFNTRVVVYFLIVGVTQGLQYFRKLQSEELKSAQLQFELSQSQVESLKMQIQPHFLFNTHHAIVSLMLKNENQKAITMLTKLSELLRYTLDKGNLQMVTLLEEMEFVKMYLDIQEVRFNNRLKVDYVIDPNANDAMIPVFLCQPLVENSVRHGISPRSDSGSISINVTVVDHDKLRIEIKDDGVGINGHFKEGIGIGNIKARLQRIYNGAYKFEINNNVPKGTVCRIELPARKQL